MADARAIPVLKFREFDSGGLPLAGGKVWTYEAGGSILKTSWADPNKATANSNPVILDAYGRADIYLDGIYRIVVTDADDVVQYTVDNVDASDPSTGGGGGSGIEYFGVDGGTANAYSISTGGDPTSLTNGLCIVFRAANANTGASTLNVNGLGAVTIKKPVGSAYIDLEANDILAGAMVSVVYDSTDAVWKTRTSPTITEGAYQVKITSADTTQSYLDDAVTVTSPLTKSVTNAGADEQLQISLPSGTGSGLDADTVDGYHADTGTAVGTVPVRDATTGKLPGDITGDADTVDGAHAGTAANEVLLLDASGLVPLGNIPTTLTGKSADKLDGYDADTGTTASTVPVRDVSGKLPGDITGDADTLDSYHADTGTTASTIPVRDATGKLPGSADMVDGYHADTGTTASTVPVRDASGVLPGSADKVDGYDADTAATANTIPVRDANAFVPGASEAVAGNAAGKQYTYSQIWRTTYICFGMIDTTGTQTNASYGNFITASKVATGHYRLTHSLNTTGVLCIVTPKNIDASTVRAAVVSNNRLDDVDVKLYDLTGTLADAEFSYILIAPSKISD